MIGAAEILFAAGLVLGGSFGFLLGVRRRADRGTSSALVAPAGDPAVAGGPYRSPVVDRMAARVQGDLDAQVLGDDWCPGCDPLAPEPVPHTCGKAWPLAPLYAVPPERSIPAHLRDAPSSDTSAYLAMVGDLKKLLASSGASQQDTWRVLEKLGTLEARITAIETGRRPRPVVVPMTTPLEGVKK